MELRAIYNYNSTNAEELSFEKGDLLIVIDPMDGIWYYAKSEDGNEGYVPSNYVNIPYRWFRPGITRNDAESELTRKYPGEFLVRGSSIRGDYALSVVKITRKQDGLYYLWENGYKSVNQLILDYIGQELYSNCEFKLQTSF